MDIRKPQQKATEQTQSTQQPAQESAKFKTGSVPHASGRLMIPPVLQTTLTAIGQRYGLSFDLNELALDGTMAEKVKVLRKVSDLAKGDSRLLPEMLKLIKSLMRSELKLAEFHKKLAKEAIRFNETIDKQTADIFLAMAGYRARSTKLEHRTNLRAQLKEKRTTAYNNYYSDSVYGAESALIDVEFETLASNQTILSESKQERIKLEADRKKKLHEYVQSAYQ